MPKIGDPGTNGRKQTTHDGTPFWQTTDGERARLWQGNVEDVLRTMPAKSVHCVITSPPYWGLRDYGTGEWEGGREDCDHNCPPTGGKQKGTTLIGTGNRDGYSGDGQFKNVCGKCGARRVDQQIGSEATPQEFVDRMVRVFSEVWRVLRDDGTVWLNLGDSYAAGNNRNGISSQTLDKGGPPPPVREGNHQKTLARTKEVKPGNMIGIPWRVAFALQDAGWCLRQDIIWHKPAPMPESIKNRCTKAHEYIFLLTKGRKYYYDAEAIKEQASSVREAPMNNKLDASRNDHDELEKVWAEDGKANKRSVWTITGGGGYRAAHFATFPVKLVEPCILAGTSEKGCCAECGSPWRRVVETKSINPWLERVAKGAKNGSLQKGANENHGEGVCHDLGAITETVGWEPGCTCEDADVAPCTVLDPFVGSGTTVAVALALGRSGWGIDLSAKYLTNNAIPRIEGEMLSRPNLCRLIPSRVPGGKK